MQISAFGGRPPAVVTIELTHDEAIKLKKVLGKLEGDGNNMKIGRAAYPSMQIERGTGLFLSNMYDELGSEGVSYMISGENS